MELEDLKIEEWQELELDESYSEKDYTSKEVLELFNYSLKIPIKGTLAFQAGLIIVSPNCLRKRGGVKHLYRIKKRFEYALVNGLEALKERESDFEHVFGYPCPIKRRPFIGRW